MRYLLGKGGTIYITQRLSERTVVMIAADRIRQERTGVHARLSLFENNRALAHSTVNVERDEERVRLTNTAFGQLNGVGAALYPKHDMKHDLDMFCWGLWEFFLGLVAPEEMPGDENLGPPEFVLAPYIVQGGGTLLYAPPGRGKSYLMLLMAVTIDAGLNSPALWYTKKARVLFVNLERSRELLQRRLTAVNRALGLDPNRPLPFFNVRGRSLMDIAASARRYIEEQQISVLFLDSISRAGLGDLNENQPANRIIDTLNSLCSTWAAIGHTPRQNTEHIYGSIHFEAGEDIGILLRTEHNMSTMGLGLDVQKVNDGGPVPMKILAFDFDNRGLAGVRRAADGEFPNIEQASPRSMAEDVLEVLLDVKRSTATRLAEATGHDRSNISRILSKDARFVQLEKKGKEQWYGVRYASG